MWTIAGGIVLALIIIYLLPVIIAGAAFLTVLIIGFAVVAGAVALLFNFPEEAVLIFVGLVILSLLATFWGIYANSRNWRLFVAELLLISVPAFSLHSKAVKEKRREEHRAAVKAHTTTPNEELLEVGLRKAEAMAVKVWRRYKKYGELLSDRTDAKITFSLNDGASLFSIAVFSNFPNNVEQEYSLTVSVAVRNVYGEEGKVERTISEKTPDLSTLKRDMRKRIKDVLLEKEREALRAGAAS